MKHVLLKCYSRFFVNEPRMEFLPVLDLQTRTWIAHAEIDTAEALAYCEANPAYEVLTDDEYALITEKPAAPAPSEPTTGDPLTDESSASRNQSARNMPPKGAATDALDGPPAPPAKK